MANANSNAQVLTHPAFDRTPVMNARRRGPTPRGIPMLRRERFEREYARQKAERERTPEQKLAECEVFVQQAAASILIAARAIAKLDDALKGKHSRD